MTRAAAGIDHAPVAQALPEPDAGITGSLGKPAAWMPLGPEASALKAWLARQAARSEDLQSERNRPEKIELLPPPARVQQSREGGLFFCRGLKQIPPGIEDDSDWPLAWRETLAWLTSLRAIGPQGR